MIYIVGHRGAPVYEPENTIESFKKAIEFGVDCVECDVHMTKDGEIIVIHDYTLDRTADRKGYVKDLTLKELRRLTVGGKYRIPTIEEILKLDCSLLIELKAFKVSGEYEIYPQLTSRLLELVEGSTFKRDVTFISFDRRYLRELNSHPEFNMMALSSEFPDLDSLKELNLYGLGIQYHALNTANVDKAHSNNLKVAAWTVDKREDIQEMIDLGVDYIISNNPRLAAETAKENRKNSIT